MLLVGRLCGYFVDHVAVNENSGTFTRSFFSACRCTRSQDRCASPCPCSVTQARVVSGTHMCLCLLLAMLFSACCWLCSFLPAVGFALFCLLLALLFSACCWLCSFHSFLRHHPNCQFYPNCVGFSWSCVRSTASLRTLFTVPPHALPLAARASSARYACRGCVSRVRMLWVVTPFQATTTLLLSSCVHLT